MGNIVEALKTETSILGKVLRRQAFAETLIPQKRNKLEAYVTRKGVRPLDDSSLDALMRDLLERERDGTVEKLGASYNSRVDAGALWQAGIMGNATAAASAQYIALSPTSLTPAKGDTTLSGETAVSGLARAIGAYGSYVAPASLGGAASYIISKTFTNGGTTTTIQSAALLNAASVGTMFVEANLASSAVLNSGDSLTIQWSINL